jgi:hypothetical protein
MSSDQSPNAFESIFTICSQSETRSEPELLTLLESVIQLNPTAVRGRDVVGTLLHYAAQFRSVPFVKRLVEADGGPECVRAIDICGRLPLHYACINGNVEVAKYFHSLYPESTNVQDTYGFSALHQVLTLARCAEEDLEELTRFLILHDQGALSMPDRDGYLPLHRACESQKLSIVKLLYDAYPEAIHVRTNRGETPLDNASTGQL